MNFTEVNPAWGHNLVYDLETYRVTEIQGLLLPHGAGVQAVQRIETPTLERGQKGKWSLTSLVQEEPRVPHGATGSDSGIHLAVELYSLSILHCSHHMPSPVLSQNVLCLSISPNAMNNYCFKSFIQLGLWPDMKM